MQLYKVLIEFRILYSMLISYKKWNYWKSLSFCLISQLQPGEYSLVNLYGVIETIIMRL